MSANLVVDIGSTCDYRSSVTPAAAASPASGVIVGQIVDLLHANTYCNLWVTGGPGSGVIPVAVQTSDGLTSGSFTDPTSGLPSTAFPGFVRSGGILHANSGLHASGNYSLSSPASGAPLFCSGGIQFGAFQRPHRYARLIALSGLTTTVILGAGFVSQKKTTSSGGGFTYNPGSGTVNV